MSAVTRPRGPLPARVYWTRRVLLLLVLLAVVLGVTRLLGGGSEGGGSDGDGGEAATPVAAEPRREPPPPSLASNAAQEQKPDRAEPEPKKDKKDKKKLPRPEGPCADSDVLVAPVVEDAHVNEPIEIVLEVSTAETPACTWDVNAESMFVTISTPERRLWSSQHCSDAIPAEAVVPRRAKPDTVTLRWNGKESDPACSPLTPWVLTGSYTVTAIARGSVVPTETEFVLQAARPPDPDPKGEKKQKDRDRGRQT